MTTTRVGVVSFATHARVMSPLNASDSYCTVAGRVRTLPYAAESTGTYRGIDLARAEFGYGARPRSQAISRVLVIVTDGLSNNCNNQCCPPASLCSCGDATCSSKAVKASADAARREGITIVTITVGSTLGGNPGA